MHCVYGQSRSAAIILAFFLSIKKDIRDSLSLLRKSRPIICINPGFLAQLFLLSVKGFDSPDIILLSQNLARLKYLRLCSRHVRDQELHGDDIETEKSPKLQKLNYSDSYRNVDIKKRSLNHISRDYCRTGSNDLDKILGVEMCEDRKMELEGIGIFDGGIDDSEKGVTDGGEKVKRTVKCIMCRHVIAREEDIVSGLDYSQFLHETTDDYWTGYKPIHPKNANVVMLDRKKKKNTVLIGKANVSYEMVDQHEPPVNKIENYTEIRCKNKNRKKNELKRSRTDLFQEKDDGRGVGDDVLVVGALPWILDQFDSVLKDRSKPRAQAPCADGSKRREVVDIFCPHCDHLCGYYEMQGLAICNSFLRCDLFALKLMEVNISSV